jgi:hypothetical protein
LAIYSTRLAVPPNITSLPCCQNELDLKKRHRQSREQKETVGGGSPLSSPFEVK